MISKLIPFFIILSFTIAKGFAQEIDLSRKIDFELSKVTLTETFRAFEEKFGVSVAYNAKILSNEKYSWTFVNEPLRNILNDITGVEELTFQIQASSILILKNPIDQAKQGAIRIEGKILNGETNEAVSFAHLVVEGTAFGTVANVEGFFKIVIPEKYGGKNLKISSIGYKNAVIEIAESSVDVAITLQPELFKLDEVTILAEKLDPVEIVKEAIDRIPENYPTQPTLLKAYYRELTKTDGRYTQFADAASQLYYSGYGHSMNRSKTYRKKNRHKYFPVVNTEFNPFPNVYHAIPNVIDDQSKLIETRASTNLQSSNLSSFGWKNEIALAFLEKHGIAGGPLRLTAYDHVKRQDLFLFEKYVKRYDFQLLQVKQAGEGVLYEISFTPGKIRGGLLPVIGTGVLTIDGESKAILKINYELDYASNDEMIGAASLLEVDLTEKEKRRFGVKNYALRPTEVLVSKVEVDYFKFNGKYYLKRVSENYTYLNTGRFLYSRRRKQNKDDLSFHSVGDSIANISFETQCDLIINDIVTKEIKPISIDEQFGSRGDEYLTDYPQSYNPSFWANYSDMIQDDVFRDALDDLEKTQSLEAQFASRFAQDIDLAPPHAPIVPDSMLIHGDLRVDNYAWLTKKYTEPVEAYLAAENDYTSNYMVPWKKNQRKFYYELVDKIEPDFENLVDIKMGNYYYGYRYEDGRPYEVYYRKKATVAIEEVLLDVNLRARDKSYYEIEDLDISIDENLLAFIENTDGSFANTLLFKNLTTQRQLRDSISNVGSFALLNDNKTVLYTRNDSLGRSFQLFEYTIGSESKTGTLLLEERDARYAVYISKSRSDTFAQVTVASQDNNEIYLISAAQPEEGLKLVMPRSEGHRYYLQEYGDVFFILSDKESSDFNLYRADVNQPDGDHWVSELTYTSDTLIINMEVIGHFLVLEERIKMKPRLKIIDLLNGGQDIIQIDSTEIYQLKILPADDRENEVLKYLYSSPTHPSTVYSYQLASRAIQMLKKTKVIGFKPDLYQTKRVYATSEDGTSIPITLIYKKEVAERSIGKLLLKAYGAYGIEQDVTFSVANLPFLDAGGIIALAHVRGGGEYGKEWYEQGKLLNKKNTFTDFTSCAEFLIAEGYGKKGELIAMGSSAGGLLMGVAINERPDLFKAVILIAPFVDAINTMLDETLPLTIGEFKEWGNPKKKVYYDYIKSYSPYDNIKAQDYPHLLFMTGYNDTYVGYWESAKMVAKLRSQKTNNNTLLLRTRMNSGHGGPSGRYASFKDMSFIYAFIASLN